MFMQKKKKDNTMLFVMEKIKHISIQQYASDEENIDFFFSKSEKKNVISIW